MTVGSYTWPYSDVSNYNPATNYIGTTDFLWAHRVSFSAPIIFRSLEVVFAFADGSAWLGSVVIYNYNAGTVLYDSGMSTYFPTTSGEYFEIGPTAGVTLNAGTEYAIGVYAGGFSSTPKIVLHTQGLGGGSSPSEPSGIASMNHTNDAYYYPGYGYPTYTYPNHAIIGRIRGDAPPGTTNMKYYNGTTWVNGVMNYNESGVWNDSPTVKGNF